MLQEVRIILIVKKEKVIIGMKIKKDGLSKFKLIKKDII